MQNVDPHIFWKPVSEFTVSDLQVLHKCYVFSFASRKYGTWESVWGSGMFVPDPGSDFFPSRIPDPNCLHPGSRILIKEFKYFNPQKSKKRFLSSKKYDQGCSSRILDPDADFLPSRIQGSKRHPIPDPGSGSATLMRVQETMNRIISSHLCLHFLWSLPRSPHTAPKKIKIVLQCIPVLSSTSPQAN